MDEAEETADGQATDDRRPREHDHQRGRHRYDPVTGAVGADDPTEVDDEVLPPRPDEADPDVEHEAHLSVQHDPAVGAGQRVEEPDTHWLVEALGQLGVRLGVVSVLLAVLGIAAAGAGMQPFGNVAIVGSLVMVSVAMVLGMVFQAYTSNILPDTGP
jgi:hypothetical protein